MPIKFEHALNDQADNQAFVFVSFDQRIHTNNLKRWICTYFISVLVYIFCAAIAHPLYKFQVYINLRHGYNQFKSWKYSTIDTIDDSATVKVGG